MEDKFLSFLEEFVELIRRYDDIKLIKSEGNYYFEYHGNNKETIPGQYIQYERVNLDQFIK